MTTTIINSQAVTTQILRRSSLSKPGRVFTPTELVRAGVGSRMAVDQALHRLTKAGRIRRVARGLYCKPVINRLVGEVPPSPEEIVSAITRVTGEMVQVSEVQAANALGVSTQVPGRYFFWTNGTTRVRRVGRLTITFRRGTPSRLAGAGSPAGTVLQAVRYLGREHAAKAVPEFRRRVPPEARRSLQRSARTTPAWVNEVAEQIVAVPSNG